MARNIFGLFALWFIDPVRDSYIFGSVYFAKSMSEFTLIESFIIYQVIKNLG
jgi:hypothetical protein